jgi:hypothetical protein
MANLLKDRDYNKPLRAYILECSIREEEAASEAIKSLLRLVKPETKTLDNKSSSLSFKNKIDLLYDIDDLNKEEYTNLIKFMELRNQFIHNPNCSSFADLSKEAPEITKFLSTKFKNDIEDAEKSYLESFKQLFMSTLGKLLVLNVEYRKGFTKEMRRYIDAVALNNFDNIFKSAFDLWKEHKEKYATPALPMLLPIGNSEKEISEFKAYLRIAICGEQMKVADGIINKEITEKDIFQRRADLMAEYEREKAELEKGNIG